MKSNYNPTPEYPQIVAQLMSFLKKFMRRFLRIWIISIVLVLFLFGLVYVVQKINLQNETRNGDLPKTLNYPIEVSNSDYLESREKPIEIYWH